MLSSTNKNYYNREFCLRIYTFIVIFNVVLFTLLLYYYVNSNIVAMSICLIVIFGIDTMIVCLFLLYLNEIEIDYCHNHLSYLFSTEVIPIKMRDDKLTKYLIQTAKFKAMLSMDDVEKSKYLYST